MRRIYIQVKPLTIIGAAASALCVIVITSQQIRISPAKGFQEQYNDEHRADVVKRRVALAVSGIPHFKNRINCSAVIANDTVEQKIAASFHFDDEDFWRSTVVKKNNACDALRQTFGFFDQALSDEERDYPLAYGMLVHDHASQVSFMLSAIYQPQNAYCIAVDGKSSTEFKDRMDLLADCFPNIFVMHIGKVKWCGYAIVRGVFNCLKYLSGLNHPWKYFQYLSGVDMPLKTNLEMVRIFKQMGGTVNAEVSKFQTMRLGKALTAKSQTPMPLWKSSLSSLFSREAADAMVKSDKVRRLLMFLKLTDCPDESLWATIAGNPDALPLPGGFNASEVYKKIREEKAKKWLNSRHLPRGGLEKYINSSTPKLQPTPEEPFSLYTYYISRYQVWVVSRNAQCHGKYTHGSCVFGVGDLPLLVHRPELIAHKFYLRVQPAAYFCLYEYIRNRALDPLQRLFRGEVYSQLPLVRLSQGASIDDVKMYF